MRFFIFVAGLVFLFVSSTFADHGPKKMWKRQIVPYFDVHKTKMFGPFKINIHSYGEKLNNEPINIKRQI